MKKNSKKNISDAERRPTRKSRERLHWIKNLKNKNPKISNAEISKSLEEKFNFTNRRARQFLNRYDELIKTNPDLDFDNSAENQIVVVTTEVDGEIFGVRNSENYIPTRVEKLPTTEEELKIYRYKKVLSPEAQAMRIDALVQASTTERGIAQIQALTLLDEICKDFSDTSEEPEPIFLVIKDGGKS